MGWYKTREVEQRDAAINLIDKPYESSFNFNDTSSEESSDIQIQE
jgi:hypothetical protein